MAQELKFGGVLMPAPKKDGGLVETYEDIWSADTGRTANGSMVGTLVATKAKLLITWNALTWEEAAKIKNAIYGKGFTTCSYPGIDGATHEITGYFGTPSFSQYSWQDGLRWATSITVNFIQK